MLDAPLEFQQRALHLDPARIAGQRSVGADDAVARHDHGDRVAPVRAADRTAGAPRAHAAGDLGVRGRLAVRDRAHGLPDAPLERRAGEVEVELELGALAREVLLELYRGGADRLGVALRGGGLAEAEASQGPVVALECQRADRAGELRRKGHAPTTAGARGA